jgi:hypothetical protein
MIIKTSGLHQYHDPYQNILVCRTWSFYDGTHSVSVQAQFEGGEE